MQTKSKGFLRGALCVAMSLAMAATLLLFGTQAGRSSDQPGPIKQAYASTTKPVSTWQYQANKDGKNTITVFTYTGKATALKVPAKINGKTVTRITFNDVNDLDAADDGVIPYSLPPRVTSLDTTACGTDLKALDFSGENVKSLNISKNTALTSLSCTDSKLASLDVSKDAALKSLDCARNSLSTLSLSHNTALTYVDCSYNDLVGLSLPKTSKLTYLDCSGNKLTNLNVSGDAKLSTLYCTGNVLVSLDISKNLVLKEFCCAQNNIPNVNTYLSKFPYYAAMPQNVAVKHPLPISKGDLTFNTWRYYNSKRQSARVSAITYGSDPYIDWYSVKASEYPAKLDLGKITTYYRENGSNTYTTTAPVKADRYGIYVKTTGSSTFAARTSYLYLGTMTIAPHVVSSLKLTPGNNKLTVSWKNYSTSSANVSYYRVYYRKAGSSPWQYKTYKPTKTSKVTLSNLANKHKYYVKVNVYRSVAGTDVVSEYTDPLKAMTK